MTEHECWICKRNGEEFVEPAHRPAEDAYDVEVCDVCITLVSLIAGKECDLLIDEKFDLD